MSEKKKTQKKGRNPVSYVTKQDAIEPREKKTVVVERILTEIYERDGVITPQGLVEEARSSGHILHGYFEWNDSKAAEKYRLTQATAMILATKFVAVLQRQADEPPRVISAQKPVREFLPMYRGEGFKGRTEILSTEDTRVAFIERKLGVLVSWCSSVVDVDEFSSMRKALEEMIAEFKSSKAA
jgi:hypothetical protein